MGRYSIRRTDTNQAEIVRALRDLGYSVHSTHMVGNSFPDLISGKHGHNYLFEIKNPLGRRRMSDGQKDFALTWNGSVHTIESVADVIEFERKRHR